MIICGKVCPLEEFKIYVRPFWRWQKTIKADKEGYWELDLKELCPYWKRKRFLGVIYRDEDFVFNFGKKNKERVEIKIPTKNEVFEKRMKDMSFITADGIPQDIINLGNETHWKRKFYVKKGRIFKKEWKKVMNWGRQKRLVIYRNRFREFKAQLIDITEKQEYWKHFKNEKVFKNWFIKNYPHNNWVLEKAIE